jgi:aspartate/methionine/tyrosine aminotransferase
MITERLDASCKDLTSSSRDILNYTATTGMPCLRERLAAMFDEHLFRGHTEKTNPDHIFVAAGASAVISMLSLALFDEGDSVLIPAPYYAGFDTDFTTVAGVVTVPVQFPLKYKYRLHKDCLEAAFASSIAAGNRPKALLINNPNNPLGSAYKASDLRMAHRWCKEKGIHLICDEVFSLSVWEQNPSPFASLPVALGEDFDDHCHVIWAASKDLCASGLRLGTLYTKNTALMSALANCNLMSMASNLLQVAVTRMLSDETWVADFLDCNRKALKSCYDELCKTLPTVQVPVTPACGGVFVWADFRQHLAAQTFEEERRLYRCLATAGVLLTPGEACHCAQPGFFRVCYAWVPQDFFDQALKRIIRGISKYKPTEGGEECV